MSRFPRTRHSMAATLLVAALLGLLSAVSPVFAQAVPPSTPAGICELRCKAREKTPPFVEIDANTGQILAGATVFADGEKVKVISSGRNPYKYEYQTQINSSPLDSAIVSSFLALIPGADSLATVFGNLTQVPQRPSPPPGINAASPANPCAPKEAKLNDLIKLSNDLQKQNDALKDPALKVETSYKVYQAFVLKTNRESIGSPQECAAICSEGEQLQPDLTRLSDVKSFGESLEKLHSSAKALEPQVADLRKDLPTQCFVTELAQIDDNVKKAKASAEKALPPIQEIQKAKASIELLAKIIRRVQTDETAFSEQSFPYTQGGPTGVKVIPIRKNLREEGATSKEVGQVDLTVGQSRFALSGGVGFSTIQDVTVVRQGNKLGEENESDLRPSLTVMLNTQLGRFFKTVKGEKDGTPDTRHYFSVSAGVGLGLVLTQRNNTTEAEFIVGPSFGFLDNRFFATLGYHTARVQSLGGGFKVGQEIPADLKDIPVDKDWKSGVMLAFTYKMR